MPEKKYVNTPIPGRTRPAVREPVPEMIRGMKRLYEYGRASTEARAANFYRQALFMRDYEDDLPWQGDFQCYFPTYHDLTDRQLRGYFTWRAKVRAGIYQPVPASLAYIYIYELINGIGASSEEDSLEKMRVFMEKYPGSAPGAAGIRKNLSRWMLEFAVARGMAPDKVRAAAGPEMLEKDHAISVLTDPVRYSDGEVTGALDLLSSGRLSKSPVLSGGRARREEPGTETAACQAGRGEHLVSAAWRSALRYEHDGKKLPVLCFGKKIKRRWYPLSNTVLYSEIKREDCECVLDGSRRYFCEDGLWYVESYEQLYFDRKLLASFVKQADLMLRSYLKTGRNLKEDPAGLWAAPYIEEAIEADRREMQEKSRPKITIDLSGLEQIREDAALTRDSLLTEEERCEDLAYGLGAEKERNAVRLGSDGISGPDVLQNDKGPLGMPVTDDKTEKSDIGSVGSVDEDDVEIKILEVLIGGRDPSDLLKTCRLMPSVAADRINSRMFDEIGDNVIDCDGDRLVLLEDYADDVREMLGEQV